MKRDTKGEILYYVYAPVHMYPPCIAQICELADRGYHVTLLTKLCVPDVAEMLRNKGVEIVTFEPGTGFKPGADKASAQSDRSETAGKSASKGRLESFRKPGPIEESVIYKIRRYLVMRQSVRRCCRENRERHGIIWIGAEKTFLIDHQRRFLMSFHPEVASFLEFYEDKAYQNCMRKAAPAVPLLTACEPHRADYMVQWWKLKKRPYILPNKPYGLSVLPGERSTTGEDADGVTAGTGEVCAGRPAADVMSGSGMIPETRAALDRIGGRRFIVYQGLVSTDRDLSDLVRGLRQLKDEGENYLFVVMGHVRDQAVLEEWRAIYPDTLYVGNFVSPHQMEVSAHAYIGIAYYADDSINNRYCAPNKIYEYASVGVPMLCNDVPGLTETVGRFQTGECVDFTKPSEIKAAIHRISENYGTYQENAKRFYDSTDNGPMIEEIAEKAFELHETEEDKSS